MTAGATACAGDVVAVVSVISGVLALGLLAQGLQAGGSVAILTTEQFLFRSPPFVITLSKRRHRRVNLRGHNAVVDDLLLIAPSLS